MVKTVITIDAKVNFDLTLEQAKALNAISVYGPEKFLEWFRKNHGKHYAQGIDKGLKELFKFTYHDLGAKIDKIERLIKEANETVYKNQ